MHRFWLASAAALALWSSARGDAAVQILRAEPVSVSLSEIAAAGRGSARASLVAHGRQFELELDSNARLLSRLPAAQKARFSSTSLVRGRVKDAPNSWVRLALSGERLQGMIWDGHEMFVIEPTDAISPHLLSSVDASGNSSVMYRLADVRSDRNDAACRLIEAVPNVTGASESAGTAQSMSKAYDALVGELESATEASSQLEVAVVGDYEFFSQNADPGGTALARLNVVDGIFSEQLGVHLVFPVMQFFESQPDGFDEDDAVAFIERFGQYRNDTPAIRERGVAHMMTGRNISGTTVGIAYRGSLCHARYGVSLSESSLTFVSSTLVIAHELGHNFGAPHDIEADSPCGGTGPGFLMSPRLSEAGNRFSICSVTQVQPEMNAARAACLTSLAVTDASVNVLPPELSASTGQPIQVPIDVLALGTEAVDDVVVTITVPDALQVLSSSITEGSCATGAGVITCTIGTMAGSTQRRIDVSMQGDVAGTYSSTASLTASGDVNSANNSVANTLRVGSSAPPPSSSEPTDKSSGGGALGWLTLTALFAPLLARGAQRVRIRISSTGTGKPMAKPCA